MAFLIASDETIKSGVVTDVYFERVAESLRHKDINPNVAMEVRAGSLPDGYEWGVFSGLEEVLELASDLPVTIRALEEGTIFHAGEPVLSFQGRYLDFGTYETAILGLICQASGIATNSARCRVAAGERRLISFGARRMHPAIAPLIERNAFIGGCDGVAVVESAHRIGEEPMGTMSHSLILCAGDEKTAFEAFDESVEKDISRVALIDTFQDEKFGALFAAEVLGDKLFGVRLDTPSSRRGDFLKILEEVRWELDARGYEYVKLFVSGGIDEFQILEYNPVADAYGVGTHISNSSVVDFSMDIVEVDGELRAKRGKKSGLKQLWECPECKLRIQKMANSEKIRCNECGSEMKGLLQVRLGDGFPAHEARKPREIRSYVLGQIKDLPI